jgi:hemerythrin-like metal-binding protein
LALITWTNKLSVGVIEIDTQHKRLIDLINQLGDASQANKDPEALGKVLAELVNYTVYHFTTEEHLMAQRNYAESPAHKAEHKKFVDTISAFKKKFDSGDAKISIDLMLFLRDWLTNHIMVTDKKFGHSLNTGQFFKG